MRLAAATTRWRLGRLLGGTEGAELLRDAERYFAEAGAVRPERLVAMFTTGWAEP